MAFSIVGQRFSPSEFAEYVEARDLREDWPREPRFIVLHNTAIPSIKQRPNGFTSTHMRGLRSYYVGQGWNGAPHLFVDQNGIWVFNPLTKRGTHSPSYNSYAFGVEMLGDFEKESFSTGKGALIRGNAIEAVATLSRKMDFAPETMKLHREDPRTDHACPGKNVNKSQFIAAVRALLAKEDAAENAVLPVKVIINGHYDMRVFASIDPAQDWVVALQSQLNESIPETRGKKPVVDKPAHAATFYRGHGYSVSFDNVNDKLYVNKSK